MYDSSGKLLGEPDSGSSAVSPICPMPVVKKTDIVYVSHFNGNILFIQSSSSSNYLTELLDQLFERYNSSESDESTHWEVGMTCCVISEDSNWYRARITDSNDKYEKYEVLFIDYGNTETVSKQQLRLMDPDFYTAELSLGVLLPVKWTVQNPPLMKYVENEEFRCLFNRDRQGFWVVDLTFISTGEKLVTKLVKESIAEEKVETKEEVAKEKLKTLDGSSIPEVPSFEVGDSVPIVVSHVDTPTMFWVQLYSNLNFIEDLQQKLQDCIEKMPLPSENSKIFAAKYTEDDIWYRAVSTGDADSVRFIDYGNTDLAPSRKQLPDELLNPQEGFAIPMYLRVQPDSGSWSEEAIKLFEAFIEQQITAEIVNVDKKILVDLKSNEKYLSKLLVEGKHGSYITEKEETAELITDEAIPAEEIPVMYDVLLLAIIDVNNFYIQMVPDSYKQIEMMEFLSDAENFEKVESCNVGDLITTKYSLDGQWYRAKIICLDPLRALFLDYGITAEINEYRALPDNLKIEPPLAIYCSLNLENTQIMKEQFAIMANDATRVFKLQFKTKGEPNIVELQMENGENISEFLSGTYVSETAVEIETSLNNKENVAPGNILENCIVCHANGPYDFYIHSPTSQGLAHDLIMKMEDAYNFPKVEKLEKGDVLAVLSSEDETWYRCKIVDLEPEISGYFIDYGNGTLVTDYRALPEEIKSFPELAIKCSLQLPDGIGGWSAEAVLTFTELVSDSVHSYDVLLISEGDAWVVELIANNSERTNITETLLKLCPAATPVTSKPATRTASPIVSEQHTDLPEEKRFPAEISVSGATPATITATSIPVPGRCYVTHVNSPNDFFIRDSKTSENLEKVALTLSELETNPKEEPYNIGDLAIAQIEGEFSRAKIIEVNPLKVSLIDVGNISETSDLLQVPDSIKNIPPTAMNCSLHIPDRHGVLNRKAEEEFSTITLSGNVEFNYRILSEEGPKPEIELCLNGENVINIINSNLNKVESTSAKIKSVIESAGDEQLLETGTHMKVTVPYVKNLKHFYIQEICEEVDVISKELLKADTFESLSIFNVGDLVAACSPDDSMWYRAKVIKVDPTEVFFIDFGNSSIVKDLRELPEKLAKLSNKALLAELMMPEGISEGNPEAETRFCAICEATFEFDCIIMSHERNMPCIVKLSVPALGDISSALATIEESKEADQIGQEKSSSSEDKGDEGTALREEIIRSTSQWQEESIKEDEDECFFEAKQSLSGGISEESKEGCESTAVRNPADTLLQENVPEEATVKNQESVIVSEESGSSPEINSTDTSLKENISEKVFEQSQELPETVDEPPVQETDAEKTSSQEQESVESNLRPDSENSTEEYQKEQQLETTLEISFEEVEPIILESEKSVDKSSKSLSCNKEIKQIERTPLKVKSVAEIKANAKPRIVTRSTSVTSLKSGRNTPSPVHKPKTSGATSKTSQPETQMRRSVSFEDKIIPGCVSGHVEK